MIDYATSLKIIYSTKIRPDLENIILPRITYLLFELLKHEKKKERKKKRKKRKRNYFVVSSISLKLSTPYGMWVFGESFFLPM